MDSTRQQLLTNLHARTGTLLSAQGPLAKGLAIAAITYLFLLSLDLLNLSFLSTRESAALWLEAISNPFVALFVGLFVTAVLQSSSTTTAIAVSLVAQHAMTLEQAVPVVMGANVGTTITCLTAAFVHITRKKEFRKAITVAASHGIFNILIVLLLMPLEAMTGLLSRSSKGLASFFSIGEGASVSLSPVKAVTGPLASLLADALFNLPLLMIVVSVGMLLSSIRLFSNVFKSMLVQDEEKRLQRMVFGTPVKALAWGTGLTAVLQSSSVTSSLVVPLVATNRVPVLKAFVFLMGANLGTTVTALAAALLHSESAVSLALAHVLFNLLGVLIFFPVPAIRQFPVMLARKVGAATLRNRLYGFVYLAAVFFVIPFFLILFSMALPDGPETPPEPDSEQGRSPKSAAKMTVSRARPSANDYLQQG